MVMVSSNLKVTHLSMTDFVILIRQHDIPCSMGQPGGKEIFGPRPTAEFYQDPYKFKGLSLPLPDNICMCPNALCHPNKPIWMKGTNI